jgi:hypothetical protein
MLGFDRCTETEEEIPKIEGSNNQQPVRNKLQGQDEGTGALRKGEEHIGVLGKVLCGAPGLMRN